MHRLLGSLVTLFVAIAVLGAGRHDGAAATGAARKWEPYVVNESARFSINTNRTWRVVEDDRKPAVEKSEFSPSSSSTDRARRIWSRKCVPGRQVVHFTRTVKLIHQPTSQRRPAVSVSFSPATTFASVEIRVNERRLLFTRSLNSTTVHRRGIFEPGLNDIEIIVVKPRGSCTGAPPALGVNIYGEFEADLIAKSLGHNAVKGTKPLVITIPFVIASRGPAPLPFVDLGINLNTSWCTLKNPDGTCFSYQFQWVGVSNLDPEGPDPKCKISQPGQYAEYFKAVSGYSAIYCRFSNLQPGMPQSLKLTMLFTLESRDEVPNYDHVTASYWWGARNPSGPREVESGDEAGNDFTLFCDEPSTYAACLEAFPPGG